MRPRLQVCQRGHEFTPENTYEHGGKRQCRECRKLRWQDDWEKSDKEPLTEVVRKAIPYGRFTSEDVVDRVWEHSDYQDLPEPTFQARIRTTLCHLRRRGEIGRYRKGDLGQVAIYENYRRAQ